MIIPAIDLIDGSVVRLFQGDYNKTTEYQQDAEQLALHYAEQGAELLHLVDLSGAKDPTKRQHELMGRIARSVANPVQAGGGIRDESQVVSYLKAGLDRVVIGSLAVRESALVKNWIQSYGSEAIVLALDINIDQEGRRLVATHGWQSDSGVEIESLLDDYLSVGARHILCTDISRDGTLEGPNADLYAALSAQYPALSIQASGGVGGLKDIAAVKGKAQGVIVGRALLEGRFTLKEAIACWRAA